jgi:hypothetical protein
MSEVEKISESLASEAQGKLFQTITAAYENGGPKEVKGALEARLAPLKSEFENAYLALQRKMGM